VEKNFALNSVIIFLKVTTMDGLEAELGDALKRSKLSIATAESCTGGLIANRLTNVSGSSRYFELGVITYSNRSKMELLKVSLETLEKFGAVSDDTAKAMAVGIRELAKTDLGLGVTGIAGPTGGTPEKPIGLVYIGLASMDNTEVFKFNFEGTRTDIKEQTSDEALKIILKYLENKY
jgi:nicotinamide-nucleotide amidase